MECKSVHNVPLSELLNSYKSNSKEIGEAYQLLSTLNNHITIVKLRHHKYLSQNSKRRRLFVSHDMHTS